MQHSLYSIPTPEVTTLDLANSSGCLLFFNYETRYFIKAIPDEILMKLTLIFVGQDYIPLQQWKQAESFNYQIQWSGPQGISCQLCTDLGIKEFPTYIACIASEIVYFSKETPTLRFLNEFETGNVKNRVEEICKSLTLQIIEDVTSICNLEIEPPIQEQSYADTISLLQTEIVNYQGLCQQQKLIIEALREELEDKNKKLKSLTDIVNSQSVLAEQYQRVQQNIQFEKFYQGNKDVKPPPIKDADFWRVQADEEFEADNTYGMKFEDIASTKGLWILNMENDKPVKINEPLAPTLSIESPPKVEKKKNNFLDQRDKHLKMLQEKQPVGRDGIKIPIPLAKSYNRKSSTSLKSTSSNLKRTGELISSQKNLKGIF